MKEEKEKTQIITITVPIHIVEKVEKEAKANDRSRSYQVSEILAKHFKNKGE